ncbi:MAG: hypothetical protein ACYC6B_00380 [Thermoleophilia bacterium]
MAVAALDLPGTKVYHYNLVDPGGAGKTNFHEDGSAPRQPDISDSVK